MTTKNPTLKTAIVRTWLDLEPKLLAWLASGLSASIVIGVLAYFGIDINPALAAVIVLVIGTIAGYLKTSTVKTPQK